MLNWECKSILIGKECFNQPVIVEMNVTFKKKMEEMLCIMLLKRPK